MTALMFCLVIPYCNAFSGLQRSSAFLRYHQPRQASTLLAAATGGAMGPESFDAMYRTLQQLSSSSGSLEHNLHDGTIPMMDDLTSAASAANSFAPFHDASSWSSLTLSLGSSDEAMMTLDASNLRPASGHSQPLWGKPDPFLQAGKSIVPPGMVKNSLEGGYSEYYSSKEVQAAASKGWKILDATTIQAEAVLPGFTKHGSYILQPSAIPPASPFTFAAQTDYAIWLLPIYQKLPYAVLAYGLLEFFILRRNLDTYMEEYYSSRNDGKAVADTLLTTGVRVVVFLMITSFLLLVWG